MKKQILNDCIGATGFVALTAGIYQQFGEPVALMAAGAMLLVFGLLASRK